MRNWFRDNGLTVALLALFTASVAGQMATGLASENHERLQHAQAALRFAAYLHSGAFLSALFENWESEFLQMWAYVMLTAYLFQRGSPESKPLDKAAPQDRDPKLDRRKATAPWPVRAHPMVRALYAHSLGAALFSLFVLSFTLHWFNSFRHAAEDAARHHAPAPHAASYLWDAGFWFESFQNWQSEFLSTALLILLAIVLRERGSPQSKPVGAPHNGTGTD